MGKQQLNTIPILYKAAGSGCLLFRSNFPVTFLVIDVFIDGNEKFGYPKNFSYICEERERENLKKHLENSKTSHIFVKKENERV